MIYLYGIVKKGGIYKTDGRIVTKVNRQYNTVEVERGKFADGVIFFGNSLEDVNFVQCGGEYNNEGKVQGNGHYVQSSKQVGTNKLRKFNIFVSKEIKSQLGSNDFEDLDVTSQNHKEAQEKGVGCGGCKSNNTCAGSSTENSNQVNNPYQPNQQGIRLQQQQYTQNYVRQNRQFNQHNRYNQNSVGNFTQQYNNSNNSYGQGNYGGRGYGG